MLVAIHAMDISQLAISLLQQRRSTPRLIADAIRLAIVRGQLAPGQPLGQEELAKQFGLSRAPIREALRHLEAEGLVVSYPHRGSVVAVLTADDVEEVFLIRLSVESTALRLSVPRMTDADLRRAEAVLEQTDSDPNPTHMGELNWGFHESIYSPCGLPRLLGMIKGLNINALRYQHIAFIALQLKEQSQRQHREILNACCARDVEGAVVTLERHLSESSKCIVSYVRQIEKAAPVQNSHSQLSR
jgi:DNA-binding GntR family transcriptional regulator